MSFLLNTKTAQWNLESQTFCKTSKFAMNYVHIYPVNSVLSKYILNKILIDCNILHTQYFLSFIFYWKMGPLFTWICYMYSSIKIKRSDREVGLFIH